MGNYKVGCPPAHPILGFSDISLAGKPNIVGIGGANMKWRHPSCYHKRENTAFNLVHLQGPWELSSPGKQDARSSIPCRKRSQVWGTENNRWLRYLQPVLEKGRIVKNMLSATRVKCR